MAAEGDDDDMDVDMDDEEDEGMDMNDNEEDDDEDEYEDEEPYYHALTDMPASSADVATGYAIITHPAPADIAVGDEVEVICAFRNTGSENLNVSFMAGSLNNPAHFAEYASNFSEQFVHRVVEGRTEASLEYKFTLPEFGIRVGQFRLALTVFYHTGEGLDAQNYSNTFMNTTVNVVEGSGAIDSKTAILFIVFVAVSFFGHSTLKGKSSKPIAATGQTEATGNDYADAISKHVRSGARSGRKKSQ